MKQFFVDRDVTSASGTQTFMVTAENEEEAKGKFLREEGDIFSNDVEVLDLGPYDFDTLYSI